MILRLSSRLTTLTVVSSLATATQFPSGEKATSRAGSVVRTRNCVKVLVDIEKSDTVPSSEETANVSFWGQFISSF